MRAIVAGMVLWGLTAGASYANPICARQTDRAALATSQNELGECLRAAVSRLEPSGATADEIATAAIAECQQAFFASNQVVNRCDHTFWMGDNVLAVSIFDDGNHERAREVVVDKVLKIRAAVRVAP